MLLGRQKPRLKQALEKYRFKNYNLAMNEGIILCSTLHDPEGGLAGTFRKASEVVKESSCTGWVINVTPGTSEEVKKELRELATEGVCMIETQLDPAHRLMENFIADDHLRVVKKAMEIAEEQGIRKVLYCDGDRVNMAARHYPNEFGSMISLAVERIGENGSYVNFRRPHKEHLVHQPPLYETEIVFNKLYSQAFGMEIDIGSTLHGMSLDIAGEIVRRAPSKMEVEYPHPTFLIAAKEAGAVISSFEVPKVLTCETPEQSRKNVETAFGKKFSSYEDLQTAWRATVGFDLLNSSREWERRFKLEGQYLKVLSDHLPNFGLNEDKIHSLQGEIGQAVKSMEGRRELILGALDPNKEGNLAAIKAAKERGKEVMMGKDGLEKG